MKTFKEFVEAYIKPTKITIKDKSGKTHTPKVRIRTGDTHIAIIHWNEIPATNLASGVEAHTEFITGTTKSLEKSVSHRLKRWGKSIKNVEIQGLDV